MGTGCLAHVLRDPDQTCWPLYYEVKFGLNILLKVYLNFVTEFHIWHIVVHLESGNLSQEIWVSVSGICSLFVPPSKLDDDGVTGQGRGSGRRESKIEWKLHSDAQNLEHQTGWWWCQRALIKMMIKIWIAKKLTERKKSNLTIFHHFQAAI